MDKWQSQYNFWSSFGIPAYDASSVPDGDNKPDYPYITYQGVDGVFDTETTILVSIWTRDFSWTLANIISDSIYNRVKDGGITIPYDGGIIWITASTPFSQNMGDPNDDLVRRKIIGVTLHFC